MSIVAAALESATAFFPDERRTWSRARQAVIDADPSLQERELLKLSSLAAAMTRALQRRGIDLTAAALTAETGVAVFRGQRRGRGVDAALLQRAGHRGGERRQLEQLPLLQARLRVDDGLPRRDQARRSSGKNAGRRRAPPRRSPSGRRRRRRDPSRKRRSNSSWPEKSTSRLSAK